MLSGLAEYRSPTIKKCESDISRATRTAACDKNVLSFPQANLADRRHERHTSGQPQFGFEPARRRKRKYVATVDSVVDDVQTALIDPLRNMKVTDRLRYGDECLIGVELFDGSRTQADNIA